VLVVGHETDQLICKLSDFGLACELPKGKDAVRVRNLVPVRWSAPELLRKGVCSLKTDIWSFAVLLYEVFQNDDRPYPELDTNQEVKSRVLSGYRLKRTDKIPREIDCLMEECMLEVGHFFEAVYDRENLESE
jgi:serine/threonine protein kinase